MASRECEKHGNYAPANFCCACVRERAVQAAGREGAIDLVITSALDLYVADVRATWEECWKGRDHRYGRDFAAFLGERLLTDFDLRHHERGSVL